MDFLKVENEISQLKNRETKSQIWKNRRTKNAFYPSFIIYLFIYTHLSTHPNKPKNSSFLFLIFIHSNKYLLLSFYFIYIILFFLVIHSSLTILLIETKFNVNKKIE